MTSSTPSGQISSRSELDAALEGSSILLFKHSPSCPTSLQAFGEYRRFREQHPELQSAWIDVLAGRPCSLAVAEWSGIKHESPQAMWIVDGEVRWHASHGAITIHSLQEACKV